MNDCEICFDDALPGKDRCESCAQWEEYWASLTPDGRQAELQMMADHASMSDEP